MIAAAVQRSCKTCQFFDRIEGQHDGKFGRCLRNPPQFIEYAALNGEWPVIKDDQWCGEHAEHTNVQGK